MEGIPAAASGGLKAKGREGRGQRAEGRGQRAEGRGQRAEGRGQRAEGRGQRAEGRGHSDDILRWHTAMTVCVHLRWGTWRGSRDCVQASPQGPLQLGFKVSRGLQAGTVGRGGHRHRRDGPFLGAGDVLPQFGQAGKHRACKHKCTQSRCVRSCHHSACARCKCSAPQQARHPPTHPPTWCSYRRTGIARTQQT